MIKRIGVLIFLIIIAFLVSIYHVKNILLPVSNDTKNIDFLISKGSSVSLIGKNLEKAGLVKSGIAFKFYVQITNSQNKIQAGEFQLSPNLGLKQVVEKLKKGPSEIWVVIPEGLRREEIAIKFADTLGKDDSFVTEFLNLTSAREGYLYPDTYLFPKAATATQIVNKLNSTFNQKVKDVSLKQLIVASLLERETFSDSEKAVVAGIIYKRIDNDWPLQIDATLQYAKDSIKCKANFRCKYWEPIFSADKEINSVFNTYKNLGLPPSPIANAGLSSIQAAMNPEDSDYWYYIHDKDAKIHFARTLEEHNTNILRYLN